MVPIDEDPRIERSRRVILEAALTELGQVGYGSLTIESVAARAGVGKSTIYRHWPGKLALVEDAFRTLKAQALVPEAGTLRERITGFLEQVAKLVEESTYSACMPALIEAAERDPQVRAFHCDFSAERLAVLVDVLREAAVSRRASCRHQRRASRRRTRRAHCHAPADVLRTVRSEAGTRARRSSASQLTESVVQLRDARVWDRIPTCLQEPEPSSSTICAVPNARCGSTGT